MRAFPLSVVSILALAAASISAATPSPAPATYDVRVVSLAPPKLAVTAVLPAIEPALETAPSRPGDVPEISDGGWGALMTEMTCTAADGKPVAVTRAGAKGWSLERAARAPLTVSYVVDYALLAERGWPAPREAAFADTRQAVVVGRSLFVTTPGQGESVVRFVVPEGWRALTPWEGAGGSWRVPTTPDLVENLIAFTRGGTEELAAGGFRFQVVPFRRWEPARAEVRRVVEGPVAYLAKAMGAADRASYMLVLLPLSETGGESFRSSFALSLETTPSDKNVSEWGGLVVHELFHYWNGWRLQGADYASTNWFREGFTEYLANVAMVKGGVLDERWLREKLARHVDNYSRLATPLDAPGDRKGPPLYGGGALVAFCWDAKIREATHGERGLPDVMRALWKRTRRGEKPYGWEDIEASLVSVARADWPDFHRRYVQGTERLPLHEAFASMGLSLKMGADGVPRVDVDPAASKDARARWSGLTAPSR